jgi:1-deoxy-D-xylulose-5-phosphate reductoisomerase
MHIIAQTKLDNPLRTLSILGSTGSIGCNTLDVVSQHRKRYEIIALTAQDNVQKLIEQALAFRPKHVAIGNEAHYQTLKDALAGTNIEVSAGALAIEQAATLSADWIMAAIVGAAGLKPTLRAIEQGAHVALANKECLVCAGELMQATAARSGAKLLPVDSEHNAIFQLFDTQRADQIEKVVLTASGGPFREREHGAVTKRYPCASGQAPELEHGRKNLSRFRNADEQRVGADRGLSSVPT